MAGLLGNESLEPPSKPVLQPEQGGPQESGLMDGRAEWAGYTAVTRSHTPCLSNEGRDLAAEDGAPDTKAPTVDDASSECTVCTLCK